MSTQPSPQEPGPVLGEVPPPRPFSTNASEKIFKIAILLKLIQRSDNKNSCVETTTQGQGQAR